MALIGLRMMPTFPSPSLRFRTAGFPRYGSKAGSQSVPSQGKGSITPPPWFASDLRVVSRCSFVLARSRGFSPSDDTAVRAVLPRYPRGPRSGPGYVVPVHHHLTGPIRPTRRRAATSPHCELYAPPSLCWLITSLGSRRAVPSFRIPFLLNLLPSYVPGESIDCLHPVFVDGVRLRPALPRTRHSQLLHLNPLRVGAIFGASWFAHLVRPAELLASLADRTNVPIGLQRLLLPSFRSSRSPSSPSDITTVASGFLHRQDFHLLERLLASLH
jgi:hypothetical protein